MLLFFVSRYPELTTLVDQLWQLDESRFEYDKDLVIDLQGQIRGRRMLRDIAPGPLFTFVNETKLNSTVTYKGIVQPSSI